MPATIMLIDDDADDRELFSEALQKVGPHIRFESASSGQMAFDLLESKKQQLPELIFLDINMPVVDGWECLSMLKGNEAFKHIPVIIYSTSAPDGAQETAIRLGALSYVLKPSQFNELKQLLARVVGLIDGRSILSFSTLLQ